MDPYAAALGFGGPAAFSAPPDDPYAAALGFPKPKAKKGGPGPGVDVAGAPLLAQSPATQAAVLADVKRTGAQNFTVNGAAPDATSVPAVAPGPVRTGAAAIPGNEGLAPNGAPANAPTTPEIPWWQKVRAAGEAGLNTVAGAVGAPVGFAYGTLEGTGTNATRYLAGQPPIDVEANAKVRAAQFVPGLPASMQTPLGKEYTENVGQFLQEHGPSLIGAGPEAAIIGRALKPAAEQVPAGRTMAAMREAFEAKKGAPAEAARVEPTAEAAPKPRYKLVDGQAQLVDQPPAGAPAAHVPSIADAPATFQAAMAKVAPYKVNPEVFSRHLEAQTLPVPIDLTAGQATQNPALLSREANLRGAHTEIADRYNLQGKQLGQNIDAIRDAAAPDVKGANHVENGQALLDSYKSVDEVARADISAKYKALADANGGSLPVNGQDFVASADAALAKQMKGRYVPKEIAADLENFRQGGPMSFEDFENLRTNLAAEGRKADRAGDGNAAGAINIVRNALESLPITGDAAALKPLADQARSAAKARFDRISSDPAYKAAVNDPAGLGDPSAAADTFINNYVVKGKVANVAKMRESLANDPAAQQTMAAGVINYLKNRAGADPVTGHFSQAGYNRALSEIQPKIDQLFDPKTAQQIQALGNVAKYTQAQPRGAFVNNSNTFTAMAADKAATAAEKAGNMAVPGLGLGTDVRAALARRATRKGVDDLLRPGAGSTRLSDFP